MSISGLQFVILFSLCLIPAVFWVWFWLREDKRKPEPLIMIVVTFLAGMAVVPLALPIQKYVLDIYSGANLIFVWVIIEETLKYTSALIFILWRKAVDEPIDMVIYMIVIALGFAVLENTLYLVNPVADGDYLAATLTGAFRYIGATLLHVLASATVGVFLAFAFYKSQAARMFYGMLGLFLAIVLHAIFNFFIMDGDGKTVLAVFLFVWIGVIILFFLFEIIKQLEINTSR